MIMKGGKNIFTLAVLTGCKKKFAVPVRVVERSQLQQGFVNGMERASKETRRARLWQAVNVTVAPVR
jgi:hypothetical protein